MKAWLVAYSQTPAFEDDDDRRAAQLLRLVLAICVLSIVGYGLVTFNTELPWPKRLPVLGALGVALLCEQGLRRGYVRPQAWVIVVGLTGLALSSQITSGGLRAPASLTLFVAVVLAGQLLGWGGALIVAGIGSVGSLLVFNLYFKGRAVPLLHSDAQYARALMVQLLGCGGLIAISARSLSVTLRRLRREQAAHRDLFEEAPDAMLALDERGKIFRVNRAMERLVGRSREQLLGEAFDADNQAIPEATRADSRLHYARVVAGEPAELFRFELTRPDGSRAECEANARALRRSDGSRGVDVVIRDVTEKMSAERRERELEEQLRAARKLEAIGQLAGGVAHDFNNLLTVVLGNLQLLRTTELDAEQDESVTSIEAAAQRAATITQQLLAIGRRQPTRPLPLSLSDSVRQLGELLRRMVPEHVSIETRLAADLPSILADPAQIDQMLLNLVANARDAMPAGGKLQIETAAVDNEADAANGIPPGHYVMLRVADTGHGMTRETKERVFEPFFTTKAHSAGTGLGLATVYSIVQQHGGQIRVDSEPGSGASFAVYFSASSERALKTQPQARYATRKSLRILLVDDDDAVRAVVATILRRAGHVVTIEPSATQALERARELGDDLELLITDVVMPGMSGLELSRELKQRRPELKVLLLSGYPGTHLDGVVSDQDSDYLAKPVTPEHLLASIDRLVATP